MVELDGKTLIVNWSRFGPYHLARLRAAHEQLSLAGVRLIGMETASMDSTYAWREEKGAQPFYRLTVFPNRKSNEISLWEMFSRFWKIIRYHRPDAIAVNGYGSKDSFVLILLSRIFNYSIIMMCASKADDAPRVKFREWGKGLLVRQASSALCGGEPHRNYLQQLGLRREKIFLGYNTVDNAFFEEGACRARQNPASYAHLPGLNDPTPFFLCSSRFISRKNIIGLLEAYEKYRREISGSGATPWRLIILGDGEEKSSITAFVAARKIEGVCLPGFRQIEELPAYYGAARVFIHPAFQEQWGLVVNEAMASGLPVLVSERCGCTSSLVEPGVNGFTFDPHKIDELASLLISCSTRQFDLDSMGRNSKRIISNWGVERFSHGLLDALVTALSGK